jgi:predicted DNA-binding transcriptional regulator AlpA
MSGGTGRSRRRAAGPAPAREEWTTVEVLAHLASQGRPIAPDTLYAYVKRGQAPEPRRVGRTLVWDPAVIREWDARRTRVRGKESEG